MLIIGLFAMIFILVVLTQLVNRGKIYTDKKNHQLTSNSSVKSFLESIYDFQYFNVELYEEVIDKLEYFIDLYETTKYIKAEQIKIENASFDSVLKYIDILNDLKDEISNDILSFSISAPNNTYMKKAQTAAEVINLILNEYLDNL